MGIRILVLWTAAIASAAGDEMVVSVRLRVAPEVSAAAGWAKSTAGEMLSSAGVRIEWCESAKKCSHWEDGIVVTFEAQAPRSLPFQAIAAAQAFEGRNIRIYADRLNRLTNKSLKHRLLAHILVHEITHILQACDRHAASGIMKATWTESDYAAISRTTLPFEPIDIHLIRLGLTKRRGVVDLAVK